MGRLANRLSLGFAGYLVLLSAAVGSTVYVLDKQHDDGLVVNLSGRQRMLTQRMTHQLLTYSNRRDQGLDVHDARARVLSTMRVFEVTLDALELGGPAPLDLDATRTRDCPQASPSVRARITRVRDTYSAYHQAADKILEGDSHQRRSGVQHIVDRNTELLSEMNAVVFLMQAEAEAKVDLLYKIQAGALLLAVLLTLGLFAYVRSRVITPLMELQRASEELSMGNMHCVIPRDGPEELRKMARSIERLRMSLNAMLTAPARDRASQEFERLWSTEASNGTRRSS